MATTLIPRLRHGSLDSGARIAPPVWICPARCQPLPALPPTSDGTICIPVLETSEPHQGTDKKVMYAMNVASMCRFLRALPAYKAASSRPWGRLGTTVLNPRTKNFNFVMRLRSMRNRLRAQQSPASGHLVVARPFRPTNTLLPLPVREKPRHTETVCACLSSPLSSIHATSG
jgi:hypothetical protein